MVMSVQVQEKHLETILLAFAHQKFSMYFEFSSGLFACVA